METIVTELFKSSKISKDQKNRIKRVYDESFYLIKKDYIENEIILKISGSTMNIYTIKIGKKDFSCDCIDYENKCVHTGMCCKHISFVFLKIGKIYEEGLFSGKSITVKNFNLLKNKLNNCWDDSDIVNKELIDRFHSFTKPIIDETSYELNAIFEPIGVRNIKDDCPVCFNSLEEKEINKCPQCENGIHKKCVKRWLTKHNTCVYCRSDVWEIFDPKSREVDEENKYLNIS